MNSNKSFCGIEHRTKHWTNVIYITCLAAINCILNRLENNLSYLLHKIATKFQRLHLCLRGPAIRYNYVTYCSKRISQLAVIHSTDKFFIK